MWSVVVPVKPFAVGKSRLAAGAGPWRCGLAHAFYLDTLRAIRATPSVRLIVVVTADPLAASQGRTMGAVVTRDGPRPGLNTAVRRGLWTARALAPDGRVAVLTADLPVLRPAELGRVLAVAREHPRAFVADHTGEGTTALTARRAAGLVPAFGPGSRHRHAATGAVEIDVPAWCGIRLDVDTPGDLAAARQRGLGPYSSALLSAWTAMSARVPGAMPPPPGPAHGQSPVVGAADSSRS